MMTPFKLLTGLFLLLCVAACSNENETPSGLKFTVLRKGDGIKLDSGNFLMINMIFKDGKDSVWNDTRKNGGPAVIQMQPGMAKGDLVMEAVMMMSKGDSITFKIPAKTLFEKLFQKPIPASVDSTSSFTFNIGLTDVLNAEQFQKFQDDMRAKQQADYEKQQSSQLATDMQIIDTYLMEKGITAEKTESGLRYVVKKQGKGENAKAGQSATMTYSGYLLNGTPFDSGTYEFVVDSQQVIAGWDQAAQLMNKGSKITVYIPSSFAYGPQRRSEVIIENSILAFDMELVDLK